jgi:hypothetical protein
MATLCIHRTAKKGGVTCNEPAAHSMPFCQWHRRCTDITFMNSIHAMMASYHILQPSNVIECLGHFWEHMNMPDRRNFDAAFQGIEVLVYLLDCTTLRGFAIELGLDIRKQKIAIAYDIVSLAWEIWHLQKDSRKIMAINRLKYMWKSKHKPVNVTDPFTLEEITDILHSERFRFRDKGHIFVFHGPSFYEHVFMHRKSMNPLTLRPLTHTVCKLLWHAHGIQWAIPVEEYVDTPTAVFASVTIELEQRHGIFIQPEWLHRLDIIDIMGIFTLFHHIIKNSDCHYMSRDVEQNAFMQGMKQLQLALAHQMLDIITSENPPSYYVCCLIVTLSRYIPELNESVPEWIHDTVNMFL